MVHGYLRGRSNLRAVVWLLDVRRDPSEEDLRFLDWLEESEIPTIPVITKVDKVSRNELARRVAKIASSTGLSTELLTSFSVLTRQGCEEVWELIALALEPEA
jgi:GTP-binding protein